MKIKTSELIGAKLDWAVAKASGAEGLRVTDNGSVCCVYKLQCGSGCWTGYYEPSTDWSQGGPLIERFKVWLSPPVDGCEPFGWDSEIYGEDGATIAYQDGCATPLIAAMRAIVADKLGEEIEVPEELV